MKNYETYVTTSSKATISSWNIGSILDEELSNILGNKDRYIENGYVKESDYRFSSDDTVRKATDDEIELYKAFILLTRYFRELK